jgi:hypothetical protein
VRRSRSTEIGEGRPRLEAEVVSGFGKTRRPSPSPERKDGEEPMEREREREQPQTRTIVENNIPNLGGFAQIFGSRLITAIRNMGVYENIRMQMARGSSEKMKMEIEAPESTTGPRRRPPHRSTVFSRATLPPPRSAFAAPSRRLRFSPPSSTSTLPHGRLATSPTPTPRSEPTKGLFRSLKIPTFYTLSPSYQFWDTCMEQ